MIEGLFISEGCAKKNYENNEQKRRCTEFC